MKAIYHIEVPKGHFRTYLEKPKNTLYLKQIHSSLVHPLQLVKPDLEGDGIYWNWNEVQNQTQIATYTADCLPILVIGKSGGALLHGGWRGIQQNIIGNENIQKIVPFFFFIGPSIQWGSFAVTEEFYQHFPRSPHFKQVGKLHYFNLQAQLQEQISTLYPLAQIQDCGICTFKTLPYNSYRRQKKHYRNWNVFSLN